MAPLRRTSGAAPNLASPRTWIIEEGDSNENPIMLAMVVPAGVLVLAACGAAVQAPGNIQPGRATGDAIKVAADDNGFGPSRVRAKAGEEISVE